MPLVKRIYDQLKEEGEAAAEEGLGSKKRKKESVGDGSYESEKLV